MSSFPEGLLLISLLTISLLALQYYLQVPSKITSELDIMSIYRVTLSLKDFRDPF